MSNRMTTGSLPVGKAIRGRITEVGAAMGFLDKISTKSGQIGGGWSITLVDINPTH